MNEISEEFSGKTVEEAVAEGLKTLGLTEDQVTVEVLEEGKKKLFSSAKARVKLTKKPTDGERTIEFLNGLFEILNISAKNELVKEEEKIEINVTTDNSNAIIGRRGEILDAIQTLAGTIANIGRTDYKRVVVDCEKYRENREETLINLAKKLEIKAFKTGRKVFLEPMNPYERRIIHATLAESTQVKTESEGKDPNRYVVIIPNNLKEDDGKNNYEPRRNNQRNGNRSFNRDRKPYNKDKKPYNGDKKTYNNDRKPFRNYSEEEKQRRSMVGEGTGTGSAFKPDYKKNTSSFFGTYLGNSRDLEKKVEETNPEQTNVDSTTKTEN